MNGAQTVDFAGPFPFPARRPLTLSSVLADERAVHVFRHQVAEAIALDWPERSRGLMSCGEAGAVVYCGECDRAHVVPYRCNARSCPTCAHIASALVVEKLAKRAESAVNDLRIDELWEGMGKPRLKTWKLVTATMWTEGERGSDARFHPRRLRRDLRKVRAAWGPFWRSVPWGRTVRTHQGQTYVTDRGKVRRKMTTRARRDTVFAMGIEVAPGGMVHLHAAVYGEFLLDRYLTTKWETQIGTAGFVNVKRMQDATPEDFRKSLHEVLKYLSKGEGGPRHHERAAAIELAMRGIRRVEMGGAIRRMPHVTALDLIYAGAKSCAECGTSGNWRWAGVRAPSYVVDNGGFGVDRWADVQEQRTPGQQAATYRGYFGGAAPPWMSDDAADELPPVDAAFTSEGESEYEHV